MQIFIRTLLGKTITIEVKEKDCTLGALKEAIRAKEYTDHEIRTLVQSDFVLVFAGKRLSDELWVEKDLQLSKEGGLHLIVPKKKE